MLNEGVIIFFLTSSAGILLPMLNPFELKPCKRKEENNTQLAQNRAQLNLLHKTIILLLAGPKD